MLLRRSGGRGEGCPLCSDPAFAACFDGACSDGLHFTPDGNKVVFEELLSVVETSFPSLKWDKMAWDFPEHLEIDGENPGKAFDKNL